MYNAGQGRYRVEYSYIVGPIEEEVNLYPGQVTPGRSLFFIARLLVAIRGGRDTQLVNVINIVKSCPMVSII